MTSSAESIGILGGGPWAIKRARGAHVPFVGGYNATMLTSPVIFGMVDGFTLTGVAYFSGSGKADNEVGAETTAVAKNPIPITQTG
uniref:Uncharacterized protein n=1 Tax=Romanomermis culicivorax TaxID=13658 RepID=A0A915IQX7_ROMCU